PALGIGDEAGHSHGALEHYRQRLAFLDVFPVAGCGATDLFLCIQLVGFLQFFLGVAAGFTAAGFGVLRALFASMVTLGTEAPAVGLGDLVTVLVEEIDVVDLLNRTPRKTGLVRNKIFEEGLGGDDIV